MTAPKPIDELRLRKKLQVSAAIVFETGWRVGSGKEGQTMSDLGVVLDPAGVPLLPGSSIKGKLRATCESLAEHLGLLACFLNQQASERPCVSDVKYFSSIREQHQQAIRQGPEAQLQWIAEHTCDVCRLFGSPVQKSRLRCSDGKLESAAVSVQVRDGVVLDRDSRKAVDGLKYDYEVSSAGACFAVCFDLDNPSDDDEALFGVALFEWSAGSSLGGFVSRGLGRFRLEKVAVRGVDFGDAKQRIRYLTKVDPAAKWTDLGNWESYFGSQIERACQRGGRED
jgi:CRISPR-associated RAMP protein (TIGR02581 family)